MQSGNMATAAQQMLELAARFGANVLFVNLGSDHPKDRKHIIKPDQFN